MKEQPIVYKDEWWTTEKAIKTDNTLKVSRKEQLLLGFRNSKMVSKRKTFIVKLAIKGTKS